jgi:hypothetical protein
VSAKAATPLFRAQPQPQQPQAAQAAMLLQLQQQQQVVTSLSVGRGQVKQR